MATTHYAAPTDSDSAIVVDVDLSILGSSPEAYGEFESNVRREYAWVPGPLYRQRRRRVPESFLRRPSVYFTSYFRDRLESTARTNLRAAIEAFDFGQARPLLGELAKAHDVTLGYPG